MLRELLCALGGTLAAGVAFGQTVTVGDPVVVTAGPVGETRWGRYQFPSLARSASGGILSFVHVEPDSASSYGLPQRCFVTQDEGKSWSEDAAAARGRYGLRLANGDWYRIATTKALPVSDLKLPEEYGVRESYSIKHHYYRMRDLAPELRKIFFQRFAANGSAWAEESTDLDEPLGLRYSVNGVFPRIWWGDIRVARDGSLVAAVYPGCIEGQSKIYSNVLAYRSTDNGHTWKLQGRILYAPDLAADAKGDDRGGFTEPALEVLKDGTLLCVMRTTDGGGVGPMYASRSRDLGKTWSKPTVITPNGVLPRLLLLANGVLVMASGRPGVDVRFSFDGRGERWSEPRALVPLSSPGIQVDSCGYTDLLPLGSDGFLIVYSAFRWPDADGVKRKTVLSRRFTVTPAKR